MRQHFSKTYMSKPHRNYWPHHAKNMLQKYATMIRIDWERVKITVSNTVSLFFSAITTTHSNRQHKCEKITLTNVKRGQILRGRNKVRRFH